MFDAFMASAFIVLIALLAFMVFMGRANARKVLAMNARIEANQREIIETGRQQAAALERIADAIERKT